MFFLTGVFRGLGWNKRVLTEDDFDRLCRRERIKVVEMPLLVSGFYMVRYGRRQIYLDSRPTGVRRLEAALHELGHHYLHAPLPTSSVRFFRLRPGTKEEYEADVFASVALMPAALFRKMAPAEVEEGYGYPRETVEFRLKVLELYGV